jgi:hypothetical protein
VNQLQSWINAIRRITITVSLKILSILKNMEWKHFWKWKKKNTNARTVATSSASTMASVTVAKRSPHGEDKNKWI